jgi:hypothetical protein
MKLDTFTKTALAAIAVFLGVIALRPFLDPPASLAQGNGSDLYIEPGVHSLRAPDGSRNVMGKVVVDLRVGNIWGFPTGTNAPYPIVSSETEPPVSRPFLLGRFDLAAIKR